jgi:hypothetical protein
MEAYYKKLLEWLIFSLILLSSLFFFDFFSSNYPFFPLLWLGVVCPIAVILLHIFLLHKVPPQKDRKKYVLIAIVGLASIPFGGIIGPLGLIPILLGLPTWIFGMWLIWGKRETRSLETPKSFIKKCANCGREIPIASEQCPYCGQKQP